MTAIRVLLRRLSGLFRTRTLERDIDDEFNFHLDNEVAENIRRGMSPDDALAAARRRFGGIAQIKEAYRETHSLPFFQVLWQDLRFGFRMLRRNPGFSILAILCLTLGIGATTAVFSWIEGILLRPFPEVAHQERLMAVAGTFGGVAGAPGDSTDFSWPDFQDFQRNCTLFDAFIVDQITGVTLAIGDRADRALGSVVSANYFDALGVRPILGRGFEPAENVGRNAHPVTVISYQMWKERFHGDPAIIGEAQMLNGMPHTIVGVAPRRVLWHVRRLGDAVLGASYPCRNGFLPDGYKLEDRGAHWIEGFVRLKPGVTPEQAQAEISAVAKRLENDYPATNRGRGVRLFPLVEDAVQQRGHSIPDALRRAGGGVSSCC